MHQRAAESDLIIVNHHLFFADLALREWEYASLLPDYEALVFDEAHDIEDVATQYFGMQVSNYRVEELARDTEATLKVKKLESAEVSALLWLSCGAAPISSLNCSRAPKTAPIFITGRASWKSIGVAYSSLLNALVHLETELGRLKDRPEEVNNLMRRAGELRQAFQAVLEGKERNTVYWWERRGRGVFMEATPIDVAPILRERLFGSVDTVVLTSATLAVGGNFDFLKRRLGIENAKERVLDSHFDYPRQALLYTPAAFAGPPRAEFHAPWRRKKLSSS